MPWRNHTQRLYHLSVSAWIVNQQGQYLLSQRHPKKQYPLYWECTGGSVLSGETSLQGAIREVKEELGILLTPGSEKLIYQTRRENVQDFYDVWLFHRDIKIEEMRLQETEVVDVQWVSSDKLFEMFRLKQLHPLITYVDQLIAEKTPGAEVSKPLLSNTLLWGKNQIKPVIS